jgi:hypothetical protein
VTIEVGEDFARRRILMNGSYAEKLVTVRGKEGGVSVAV